MLQSIAVSSWISGWMVSNSICLFLSAYIYFVVRFKPIGYERLLYSLPVFPFYILLPWIFEPSAFHIGTAILFCCITWLASFRLFNFCWGYGAASDPWIISSFFRFHAALCFPIHIRPAHKDCPNTSNAPFSSSSESSFALAARLVFKLAIFALILSQYDVWKSFHPLVVKTFYSYMLYVFVTMVYEFVASLSMLLFDVKLDSYFDRPYLACTFEEFWSRRWNILVSSNLRETVYTPLIHLLCIAFQKQKPESKNTQSGSISKSENSVSKSSSTSENENTECKKVRVQLLKNGKLHSETVEVDSFVYSCIKLSAMMASFCVSGMMHEVAVYYLTFRWTGEMTAFFVLHGMFTAFEVIFKRRFGWKMMPREIPAVFRNVFTVGVTLFTAHLLFFAPLSREKMDIKVIRHLKSVLGC